MSRIAGWRECFFELIEEWRHRPLVYGQSDCFQFAGAAVLALTGVDHRPRFGVYTSRREAARILCAYGGPAGILSACFGDPIPVLWAALGDLVIADFHDGVTVGVCLGNHCCTPGPAGLAFLPMSSAIKAWRI